MLDYIAFHIKSATLDTFSDQLKSENDHITHLVFSGQLHVFVSSLVIPQLCHQLCHLLKTAQLEDPFLKPQISRVAAAAAGFSRRGGVRVGGLLVQQRIN